MSESESVKQALEAVEYIKNTLDDFLMTDRFFELLITLEELTAQFSPGEMDEGDELVCNKVKELLDLARDKKNENINWWEDISE